jgi:hypothetical protein
MVGASASRSRDLTGNAEARSVTDMISFSTAFVRERRYRHVVSAGLQLDATWSRAKVWAQG